MNHWGVPPCCTNPPVANADHRNHTHTPRNATESHPHPTNPRKSSGVTIVGPTTAIDTHTTSQNQCAQDGRDTIDTCCAPGPNIATVWTSPTPVYTHAASYGRPTHTQPKQSRCVPFSNPHVHKLARSDDTRQECTHNTAKTMGDQSTTWRGHTRPTTSPKEE